MERFLYRLSTTAHRAQFVLKDAVMLHVWDAPLARATKDLDFLGRLREVCAADVEPDGMVFDPATVKTERITEDADYERVGVRFVGLLGKARVTMQIDVGFGDVVTPGAQDITYPALLGGVVKAESRRWVEAGIALAKDPEATILCPACAKGPLEVTDQVLDNGKIERHMRCPLCGAYNSLRLAMSGPTR